MKNTLFVINPISGDQDKSGLPEIIKKISQDYKFQFKVYKTTGKNDKNNIQNEIDKFLPETVVVAGGDGTVSLVASLLVHTEINLGIIPMGSANGLAYELGIPAKIEQAVDILLKGKSTMMDAIKIEDRYAFHLCDMGMNARIIKRFEKEGKRGLLGYAKQFLKEYRNIKKFHCRIEANGQTIRHKALVTVLANGSYYGTGATINPTGKFNDGFFEIILIRPYPSWFLLKLFFAFFTRQIHKLEYIQIISCKNAVIETQPPQYLQMDGEILSKTHKIKVKIVPDAIKVISAGKR